MKHIFQIVLLCIISEGSEPTIMESFQHLNKSTVKYTIVYRLSTKLQVLG